MVDMPIPDSAVDSRESLVLFIDALVASWHFREREAAEELSPEDFVSETSDWNATNVAQFLEGMRMFAKQPGSLGSEPRWRDFARLLAAGRRGSAA
jgi:hypothetical protein